MTQTNVTITKRTISPEIAEQKKIATEVLKLTQDHVPGSLIAGGAPRNWYLGLAANDIDIFVPCKDYDCSLIAEELGINVIRKGVSQDPEDFFEEEEIKKDTAYPNMMKVFEAVWKDEVFQWICFNPDEFVTVPDFVISTFDFNICKCFFDERGVIQVTDEAQRDFDEKTLSLPITTLSKLRIPSIPARSKKLQTMFPDYTLTLL